MPSDVDVIPGLQLAALGDLWQSLGMACASSPGAFPDSGDGYAIHCEGSDESANVDLVAESAYWTAGGIQTVSIVLNPITEDAIDMPVAAERWLIPLARLVGGDEAATLVRSEIGNLGCGQGCPGIVGANRFTYYSGSRGAQKLSIAAEPS